MIEILIRIGDTFELRTAQKIEDYIWIDKEGILCRILEEDGELIPNLIFRYGKNNDTYGLVILGKYENAKEAFRTIVNMHSRASSTIPVYDESEKDRRFLKEFKNKSKRMVAQYEEMFDEKL